MILKKEVEIGEDETTGELWERLAKIGGELLVETIKQLKKIENDFCSQTQSFLFIQLFTFFVFRKE